MFSGLMQDWTTMDGAGTAASVQARADWLDLAMFADVVFWLEVRAVSNPGAGNVTLTYETSPSSDDSLFQPLGAVTLAASSTPVITKVQLSSNPAVPLARFVRWKLAGTAAGNWSVTFRIFAMANKGSAGGFDPAALNLTGWWRGSYAGAPWGASASAGPSSTTGSLSAGVAPATGAAQNGFTPADFDGSTQFLVNANDMSSTFLAGAGTIVALFRADTAAAPAGGFDDPAIFADSQGFVTLAFTTSGVRAYLAGLGFVDSAASVGSYHLAMMRWDGSTLGITVDSGAEVSAASSPMGVLTGTIQVGKSSFTTTLFDGAILELMTSRVVFTNGDYANVKRYVNSRYGLSL